MHKIELCGNDKCTQCYACVNSCTKGAITMIKSSDGFKIPQIDRNVCSECGACVNSCHCINSSLEYKRPIKTLACWTKILSDREKSSSGGAFSVLARKVIDEGGIVFGACMDENLQVRHIGIEKESDIILLQGSKYVQSYLGNIYKQVKEHLRNGRKVLFTGTPCQVGGLLTFLKKKYENLLTCDLVCHGVPSQESFDIYIDKIGIRDKSKCFNFRYTKGWGMQLSRQTNRKSRLRVLSPRKAYYYRAFEKGYMFSEACYSCAYARPERVADFTLADFWGIGKAEPFLHPVNKGISMMLVNSDEANKLISGCYNLFFEERTLNEAIQGNHNLSKVSCRPVGRDAYYEDSKKMSINKLCCKYAIEATLRDYFRIVKQFVFSLR